VSWKARRGAGTWENGDRPTQKNYLLAKIACAMTLQHEKRKSFLNAYP
jgi:hypothetical protein